MSDTELLPKPKPEQPVRRLEVFTGTGRRTAEQKAKRLGPASKARDGYMVAEDILDPPQIRRFGSDLEL